MAILRRTTDQEKLDIPADALLGRDDSFDVRLTDDHASAPHARLRWHKERWHLQDLASRNGTFVNGQRLRPGESIRLSCGAIIQLGGKREEYRLEDDSPPQPLGRHLKTGKTVAMQHGLLTLPDANRALASIYPSRDNAAGLVIDIGDRVTAAIDREVVELDGELWQLRTLVASQKATNARANPMTIESLQLTVWASANLEEIKLTLVHGGVCITVEHYSWHYLLLVLGRERVRDGDLAEVEQGWVERDRLCKMLNMPTDQLNVAIHRAREQFRRLGVLPSAGLIERRRGPRDIRLGVRHVQLEGHAKLR